MWRLTWRAANHRTRVTTVFWSERGQNFNSSGNCCDDAINRPSRIYLCIYAHREINVPIIPSHWISDSLTYLKTIRMCPKRAISPSWPILFFRSPPYPDIIYTYKYTFNSTQTVVVPFNWSTQLLCYAEICVLHRHKLYIYIWFRDAFLTNRTFSSGSRRYDLFCIVHPYKVYVRPQKLREITSWIHY